jgi:hypothetical protein
MYWTSWLRDCVLPCFVCTVLIRSYIARFVTNYICNVFVFHSCQLLLFICMHRYVTQKTKTAREALANLDPLSVTTKATIYESAHILDKAMNLEKVPC